ncbi:MAG: DUF3617 family protein [Acidobacteria bacterium]|nr:DUF3617 family protein [Acidobacteriota bacterium]
MSQAARTLKTLLCATAILGAAAASSRAAGAADHPNLQPGNWETTVNMEMSGMPAGMPARPPMTFTHCIKPDEIKDNQSLAEKMQSNGKSKCKVSDIKFDNDKLSYSFACESGASGSTELVFGGTTYEGTTKMSVPGHHGNGPMTMTQHFKSKRLGDC